MQTVKTILTKQLITSVVVLFMCGALIVSATAPSGGYTPGSTLDPTCAPGSSDCVVQFVVDGSAIVLGSDVVGDMMYFNGTDYVRLPIGTAGQILTTNGGATAPVWSTAANTLYSGNGTLTAHRTITSGGFNLTYDGTGDITLADSGLISSVGLTSTGTITQTGNLDVTGTSTFIGNISQTGANTFSTGTGAVSLNGDTTLVTGKTLTLVDMTPGSLVFAGTGGVLSQNNAQLFWNNTTNRLGIGTLTPANKLEITQGTAGNSGLRFTNLLSTSSTTAANGKSLTVNATGDVILSPNGGLMWYAENTTAPATLPTATGAGSIAIGNNATATSSAMFVYGANAGVGATTAAQANFIGPGAGNGATNATNSNFIGANAGLNATGATQSNFIGTSAGQTTTNTANSNFIGYRAGLQATNATNSNFLGNNAGANAAAVSGSNFLGGTAGQNATNARDSNFLGNGTGSNATNALQSNFIGSQSGQGATNAPDSNFLGYRSGLLATNANSSNFIGRETGRGASAANNANFLGYFAGYAANNANNSTFIGFQAGHTATNANNAIFIGSSSGTSDTVNNTGGKSSILIGDNTSTGGFSDSIALGKGAVNTAINQLMIGSASKPINSVVITGSGFTTCSVNTTTGVGIACSSDERLKTHIADLSPVDALKNITQIRAVHYNWKSDPDDSDMIGFLAQDLQQYYPQIVSESSNGYLQVNYAGMTPVIVAAIRQLNTKVDTAMLSSGNINGSGLFDTLKNWLGSATNGLTEIFADRVRAKNEICIDDVCITRDQLRTLLQNAGSTTDNTTSGAADGVPLNGGTTGSGTTDTVTPPSDTSGSLDTNSTPVTDIPPDITETPTNTVTE